MTNLKKRVKNYNRYPNELKRKIAKEYLSGQASYRILAEENGLKDKGVVKEFVRWYKRQMEKEGIITSGMNQSNDKLNSGFGETDSGEIKELKRTISTLREQLSKSALKVEMLETMIDVAESDLLIDIRKKSGTNRSKR